MTTPREQLNEIFDRQTKQIVRFGNLDEHEANRLKHIAREYLWAVLNAGWTPPPTPAHNTTLEN